jgi:transposase-like protein
MQFQVNAAGKRIYPSEFKAKVLTELRGGATAHELGRRYGIPIQNILNWKAREQSAVTGSSKGVKEEETVSLAEYKKAVEEIKNLRRSLVNMTVDRDILKEAHDIAVKKKWILPAK